MRRRLLPALLLLVTSPLLAAPLKWNESIRDVYFNGNLVRDGETLVSGKLLAWLPASGDALVFDKTTHQVSTTDRAIFTLADDMTTATTEDDFPRSDPKPFVMADDSTFVTPTMLIHAHVSRAGAMTENDLWSTAPVWRAIHDHYAPDAKAVARLRDEAKPTSVRIVFATWCGDSKKAVPRLLRALGDAGNPLLHVELVGVGPDFLTPLELIRDEHVTNVPTIIVTRGAAEVGRIVETASTTSVESDLAAILDGTLPPNPGRYERKTLIVNGTYDVRDKNGAKGVENFELWSTPKGGLLVRSIVTKGNERIETFAALDANKQPDFVEVTRTSGKHVVRTRCHKSDGEWVVVARGDEFGISEQHTVIPATLVTPATITLAWPLFCPGFDRCDPLDAYVISDDVLGHLTVVRSLANGNEFVPVSTRMPPRIRLGSRSMKYEMETLSALNLPKHVRFADGSERRLVSYVGTLPGAMPATAERE